jgi:hypothetical protein
VTPSNCNSQGDWHLICIWFGTGLCYIIERDKLSQDLRSPQLPYGIEYASTKQEQQIKGLGQGISFVSPFGSVIPSAGLAPLDTKLTNHSNHNFRLLQRTFIPKRTCLPTYQGNLSGPCMESKCLFCYQGCDLQQTRVRDS